MFPMARFALWFRSLDALVTRANQSRYRRNFMSHLRLHTCTLLIFTLAAAALAGCAGDMSAPEDNPGRAMDREGVLTGTNRADMAEDLSLERPAAVTVHLQP